MMSSVFQWCGPKLRCHSHDDQNQLKPNPRPKMSVSARIQARASSAFSLETHNVNRRSANYAPSVWGEYFLAYVSEYSKENFEDEEREQERLKEEVRKMLIATSDPESRQKLDLIDAIQRLGVSYHFENEIEAFVPSILEQFWQDEDLHVVALRFRLLRQLGHYVSCDVFNKFKDPEGRFKESLVRNVRGLLSFYEAANFRLQDEDILKDAMIFTTCQLQSKLPNLNNFFAQSVKQALAMPVRKTVTRIGARQFISLYQQDISHDAVLLKFAKLDFNILQRLHQKELSTITQWWKRIDCPKKYPFARDRLVECYLWILAVYFEPKYSFARTAATKMIALASILDDMYDVYGTLDELILFTDSIERWHISALDQLPLYMRDFYRSLLDVYSEMEERLAKYDKSNHVNYAISALKDLTRAYLEEAKWVHNGRLPSFEEYMKVALVSVACQMLSANYLVCMGEFVTKDQLDWVEKNPLIIRASSVIGRLLDDMATYEAEKERGEMASAIECYMQQYGSCKEETFVELEKQLANAWKDTNLECLNIGPSSAVPMFIRERILNLSKSIYLLHGDGDGYGNCSTKTKDLVTSVLVHPLPI